MSSVIYLDNQATTPMDRRVLDAMLPWMASNFGNAHSHEHVLGDAAADAVESARGDVAALVGTSASNVVFTSGATESINMAIEGFCHRMCELERQTRIALPPTEHSAVIETCQAMVRKGIAELEWVQVDSCGRIDIEHIESLCRNGINLVCVMGASNEIGNIYPVAEIAAIVCDHGAAFLCDGSQLVGKTPFNFNMSHIDFLAISAHKMYGPKGIGALIVREPGSIKPTRYGGSQELGLRPGTLNVPGIVGLGVACRLRMTEMDGDEAMVRKMRDRLQSLLCERISNIMINGDPENRLAGNLHFSVANVLNDAVTVRIRNVLAISTGAACSSGVEASSHVLRAIGLSDEWIGGTFRIGIGKFNEERDVSKAADILCEAIGQVRETSIAVQ